MKNNFWTAVILVICLIFSPSLVLAGNVIFQPVIGEEIPEGFLVNTVGGGRVNAEDGNLVLSSDGSGVSVARVETPETDYTSDSFLAFEFTAMNTEAENSVGILAGGKTYPVMTISQDKLTVQSVEFTLDTALQHYAVIKASSSEMTLWIDGNELYNGVFNSADRGMFYFSATTRKKGVEAEFRVCDIMLCGESEYLFESELTNIGILAPDGLSDSVVSFNIPLVTPPEIVITAENGNTDVLDFEFKGNKLVIKDFELLPQTAYTVTISGIVTVSGIHDDEILTFSTIPEGYEIPQLSISGVKETYWTGNALEAIVSANPDESIISTSMYVNGTKVAQIEKTGKISYEFTRDGIYDFVFEIYDGTAKVKSEVYTVKVDINEAPVIEPLSFSDGSSLDPSDIRIRVTDDFGVESVNLFVNDAPATLSDINGDVYTFTCDVKVLGDATLRIGVVDSDYLMVEEEYDVRISKKSFNSAMSIVDYDTNSSGITIWLQGIYTSSQEVVPDKVNPDKNNTLAYVLTRPAGVSGSLPYATKGVSDSGSFRLSCDMYLIDPVSCIWMVRGSGSEYINTVTISSGKLTAGDNSLQLETGRWYHMTYCLDTINQTYEFLLDGEYVTPPGGLPLPSALSNPKINDIRINMYFDDDQSAAFDNWTFEKLDCIPEITDVDTDDCKTFRLKLDGITVDDIAELDKNAGGFTVTDGIESMSPLSASYDSEHKEIILDFERKLHTSCDYTLCFDASIIDVSNISDGEQVIRHFRTPPASIDITDFEYIRSKSGIGARAVFSNMSGDEASAIMILSVYDKNGGIISLRATAPAVVESGEEAELYLDCENTDGSFAEVMFINNWSDFVALKGLVYKINLK